MMDYLRMVRRLINYCRSRGYSLQFYNCKECYAVALDEDNSVIRLHINSVNLQVWRVRRG